MKNLLLALVFVFGFGFLLSNDSYATDYTYTFDSVGNDVNMCTNEINNTSLPQCNTIKMVNISVSPIPSDVISIRPAVIVGNDSNCSSSGSLTTYFQFNKSFSTVSHTGLVNFCGIRFGSSYSWNNLSNYTFTFVLSTDVKYESSCPEPEPCPDPEENSRFIQVVIDAFWKYHIGFASAAAAILAIFFVYRIIKGRLR